MRHKIFLGLLAFFFLKLGIIAQEEQLKADSTLSNLFYEVGFGFSNFGEMVLLGIDEKQIFPEHDRYAFSLSQQLNKNKYLRFGFVYGSYKIAIVGGYNRFISPLVVTIGLEKKKAKNRWAFSYGSDIYYATSLKMTNVGGVFWQAQRHALGMSGVVGGSYFIMKNLSVRTETEIGAGVRMDYKNKGFIVQRIIVPELRLIKGISLELKYHF